MAKGLSVRIPTTLPSSQGHTQAAVGESRGNPPSSSLASEALVCGPSLLVCRPSLAHSSRGGYPDTRGSVSSGPLMAQSDCLAVEWCSLRGVNIPADVIQTIQALWQPSTDRIYLATWWAFCAWCDQNGILALQASIVNILGFLQEGLSKGLSPNTLRRQVAAISMILTCGIFTSLAQHPLICHFLQGATNLCPPALHRYPTWDLPIVLNSLTGPPV